MGPSENFLRLDNTIVSSNFLHISLTDSMQKDNFIYKKFSLYTQIGNLYSAKKNPPKTIDSIASFSVSL